LPAAIALAVVIIGVTSAMKGRNKATEVRMEKVQKRDLVASVTASGQVQPHTKVDISADISGRIVRLAVREGQMVTAGSSCSRSIRRSYRAAMERATASSGIGESTVGAGEAGSSAGAAQSRSPDALKKANPTLVSDGADRAAENTGRRQRSDAGGGKPRGGFRRRRHSATRNHC